MSQYLSQLLKYTRREEREWGQLLLGADRTRRSAKAGLAKYMVAQAGKIAGGADVDIQEFRKLQTLSNRVAEAADGIYHEQVEAAKAELDSLVEELRAEAPPSKRVRINAKDDDAPMPASKTEAKEQDDESTQE